MYGINYKPAAVAALLLSHAAFGQVAALTGHEIVQVVPVLGNGAPSPVSEMTTTRAIADLAGSVVRRPPSLSDDATAGYKVGDQWLYNGVVYTLADATAGKASWVPVNGDLPVGAAGTLPGDAVAGAANCFGPLKMRASATSDFIVTRASDSTTLTVGFVGNQPDSAAADAFCNATSCTVTTLFDQCGTNNAVAADVAHAPIWTSNTIGGRRVITFNAVQGGGTQISKYLTISGTLALPENNLTVFAVAQPRSTNNTTVILTPNLAGANALSFANGTGTQSGMAVEGNYAAIGSQTGAGVYGWIVTSGVGAVWSNNETAGGVTVTQTTVATTASISFNSTSGNGGVFDLSGLIVYNSGLASTSVTNLRASLFSIGNVQPQARSVVVFDGDSIALGYGTSFNRSWARAAQSTVADPTRYFNIGVPSWSMTQNIAAFNAFYGPIYDPKAPLFIVDEESGINDIINNSASATTLLANLRTYVGLIKGLGPNVRVVVHTLMQPCTITCGSAGGPRITAAQLTQLQTYNTMLQQEWTTFADGLVDYASSPTMGTTTATQNTALFIDGLHPTDLGDAYLAPIDARAINALIR